MCLDFRIYSLGHTFFGEVQGTKSSSLQNQALREANMLRLRIAAFCLLFGFASSAFACNRPIGPEDFCGTYRAAPKTSFYKINGQLADFEMFANVKDLVQ